jgi:dihydrofolate synthase/folylpolyglutamate synthase
VGGGTRRGGALDYDRAVEILETALQFGIDPSLGPVLALAEALGRPHDAFASVQVAGTNGKSSVTRMLAALLCAHGETAASYTSPHLESYTERLEFCGERVGEGAFARATEAVLDAVDELARGAGEVASGVGAYTEFVLLTGLALWAVREHGAGWACLEVGLGGRWDATSVVDPMVAVVTGVGLDHTDRLGETLREIAGEKACIISPGSTCVLGPGTAGVADVFVSRAADVGAPVVVVCEGEPGSEYGPAVPVRFGVTARPDRPGGITTLDVEGVHASYPGLGLGAPSYQAPNAAVAVAAAEVALGRALDADAVRGAFGTLALPGRFEVVADAPTVVLDGAHNPQAAEVLAGAIIESFGARPPDLVLGVLGDKDVEGIVSALVGVARRIVCTENSSPRCLSADELAAIVRARGGDALIAADVSGALDAARGLEDTAGVVVTGSLYTAGEARTAAARYRVG